MEFNGIIFPAPKPSYTAQDLFGNIIYVPKYSHFSISEIQALRATGMSLTRQPTTTPANSQKPRHFVFDNPAPPVLKSQECEFYERDYIPCLFLPYEPGSTKVLLYFHGNAEDLGIAMPLLELLKSRLRTHVVAMEYPGYGIYEGKPSAERILEDSEHVFCFLTKVLGIRSEDILVFGRSIGSGPATAVAAGHRVFSLFLMSPYTSIRAVARHLVGRLGQFLVAERFRNVDYIARVRSPVLIIHGLKDRLIPFEQAQELCENCQEAASLVLPEDMDHNVFEMNKDLLFPLRNFLERHDYNPTPRGPRLGKLAAPDRLFVKPLLGNRPSQPVRKGFFSWLFS